MDKPYTTYEQQIQILEGKIKLEIEIKPTTPLAYFKNSGLFEIKIKNALLISETPLPSEIRSGNYEQCVLV